MRPWLTGGKRDDQYNVGGLWSWENEMIIRTAVHDMPQEPIWKLHKVVAGLANPGVHIA
jgi:hypothetical protein